MLRDIIYEIIGWVWTLVCLMILLPLAAVLQALWTPIGMIIMFIKTKGYVSAFDCWETWSELFAELFKNFHDVLVD